MKYYAVIDTNVLISALLTSNPNSATVLILKYVLNGKIIPLYSSTILDEYKNPSFYSILKSIISVYRFEDLY